MPSFVGRDKRRVGDAPNPIAMDELIEKSTEKIRQTVETSSVSFGGVPFGLATYVSCMNDINPTPSVAKKMAY